MYVISDFFPNDRYCEDPASGRVQEHRVADERHLRQDRHRQPRRVWIGELIVP